MLSRHASTSLRGTPALGGRGSRIRRTYCSRPRTTPMPGTVRTTSPPVPPSSGTSTTGNLRTTAGPSIGRPACTAGDVALVTAAPLNPRSALDRAVPLLGLEAPTGLSRAALPGVVGPAPMAGPTGFCAPMLAVPPIAVSAAAAAGLLDPPTASVAAPVAPTIPPRGAV